MSRHHVHLDARRWQAVRRAVFERDGYRCVECGRSGRLECDHITPLDRGGDPWDLDNLQALCRRLLLGVRIRRRSGAMARSW